MTGIKIFPDVFAYTRQLYLRLNTCSFEHSLATDTGPLQNL